MKSYRELFQPWIIPLLAVFYAVGLIGLLHPFTRSLFQQFIPWNIFISILLVFVYHPNFSTKFILSFLAIALAGFFVEVLGVSTGNIFGSYYYLSFLGPKLFKVPLLIGLNWFLLVYCASCLLAPFQMPITWKAIGIAVIMLAIDISLEFFAISNQMWIWTETGWPPLQNFIAWFIIAFIFAWTFLSFNKEAYSNRMAKWVCLIMFVFFIVFDLIFYIFS